MTKIAYFTFPPEATLTCHLIVARFVLGILADVMQCLNYSVQSMIRVLEAYKRTMKP